MSALLNGQEFRVDPYMVSWAFTPKVRVDENIGGKVVQVYGAEIGPLTVQGSFGIGGWQEQKAFLARMKELADSQLDRYPAAAPQPGRFTWVDMDWDMLVWLMAFQQVGASDSIQMSEDIIDPKWQLTLKVVEDNSGLKQVATDEYIDRIAAGLGWHQTVFNGPLSPEQAIKQMQQAGASNVRDFVNIAFGIGNPNTNTTGTSAQTDGGGVAAGTRYTPQQIAQVAKAAGFSGEALVIAIAIALAESGGQIDIAPTNSDGSIDRGLWQINSVHATYDPQRLLTDPVYNGQAAYTISGAGANWSPWYTFDGAPPHNGAYRKFLDAAREAAGV